jgi:hypothetical protein
MTNDRVLRASDLSVELANRYVSAARGLLASEPWAACLLICAGIDAFGALYMGRVSPSESEEGFHAFIERYIPLLSRVRARPLTRDEAEDPALQDLVWASEPAKRVRTGTDVLYRAYRSGLTHLDTLAPAISIVNQSRRLLFTIESRWQGDHATFKMSLDAGTLVETFASATQAYIADLAGSVSISDDFWACWEATTSNRWVTSVSS